MESVPESSILGVGCGAPINFADIHEGEIVVDIGSGGGIDVFLAANKVKEFGKAIGIDMTDEMLVKARDNAKRSGFTNVEFKKGDIESGIPIENNAADVVISNCVINLTIDKVAAFKEIYRILRSNGRMIISDLVTSKEIGLESANSEEWCSCIDGALTKENYLDSIRKAISMYKGANKINMRLGRETNWKSSWAQLNNRDNNNDHKSNLYHHFSIFQTPYIEADGRKITSLIIKAVK